MAIQMTAAKTRLRRPRRSAIAVFSSLLAVVLSGSTGNVLRAQNESTAIANVKEKRIRNKGESSMQKITPFLWFDGNAEEAMKFYTSIFKNSKIRQVHRWGEGGPGPKGTVMSGTFELDGQEFMALNGGPDFTFSEAISFFVKCETQEEVDELWERLSEGGQAQMCGWLKDKFGVTWQIIPTVLEELLHDKDPEKAKRVMEAMLKMKKIDIKLLKEAYDRR